MGLTMARRWFVVLRPFNITFIFENFYIGVLSLKKQGEFNEKKKIRYVGVF